MRYLRLAAIAKRLRAVVSQSRLVASVQSNRLRLKDVFIGIFIFIKDLFDSVFITETVAKSVGKDEEEAIAASDSASLQTDKPVEEQLSTLDDVDLFLSKLTSEQLAVLEQASLSVGIPQSDSYTVSDSSVLEFVKGALENPSLADEVRFDVAKFISDIVYHTDDVGGEATVDDDQTIQFLKVRSDLAFVTEVLARVVEYNREFAESTIVSESHAVTFSRPVSDTFQASEFAVKVIGKGESDTLAGVDSGTLLNQDYVDNPYYFADDYVGDKRIF